MIPGGESTTIDRLCRIFGLHEPIRGLIAAGLPVYGSCAGMIQLADEILDGHREQRTVGGIDMTVRRNAFGRQVDSFETDLAIDGLTDPGRPFPAVFIRAPWVERVGPGVEVLASVEGRPAAVRQGRLLATSFHPEITDDHRLHELFVEMCMAMVADRAAQRTQPAQSRRDRLICSHGERTGYRDTKIPTAQVASRRPAARCP